LKETEKDSSTTDGRQDVVADRIERGLRHQCDQGRHTPANKNVLWKDRAGDIPANPKSRPDKNGIQEPNQIEQKTIMESAGGT